ncbi:uncharacterized protein LOC128212369 isoform X1 [Mya arenaria]|uniref:uncharacterized protein LOC128212369 isoform X1 n=1 Tax=Mya arenaria TaxID=6604 RepID=UPI0022DEC964|nr:uncharacterized protein LOC128212369 isoform X1 [Mya arenaria]
MSESTPGIPIKGVGRVDYSSKENSQQMQSGILCPSTSLSGNRPTNQAAATIEENIRTDSDGYRTMERSTLQETPTQFKYTMHNSFNNKNIQPKLKYTGKGPPKALQGNNNHQSAGSIRQSGRSKHVSLQGDASSYGFDTSAGSDKLKSNGEYEISKQGRVWCIRDLKTNNLTTLKNIKAYDVFFESKELVSVDGVFHQLIVHNGKKPKLQIAERSSSSSEDERKPNACDFSSDGDNNDHDDKQHMAEAMEYSESGNDNVREGWRDRSSPTPLKGSQRPDVASKIETSLSKQSHNTQDTLKDVNSGPGQQQDDMSTSLKRFDANSMTNAKGVWKANEGKVEKPLSYGDYVLKKILNKWTLKNRKTGRSSLINQKEAYFEEEYLVLDGEIFEVRDIDGTPTKWRLDGTIKDDQVDSKEDCKEKTERHKRLPLLTQSTGKHEELFIKCTCFIDGKALEGDVPVNIKNYVKWLFIACENENVGQSEVKELHHLGVLRLDVKREELLIYLQKGFDEEPGFKEIVKQTVKTILKTSSHIEVEEICATGFDIKLLFERLHDEEMNMNYVAFYEEESSSLFIACSSNTKKSIIGHLNSALTVCYRHEFTKPKCVGNMVNHVDFQSMLRETHPKLNVSVKTDGFTTTLKACGSKAALQWLDEKLRFNEVKFTDIKYSDHVKIPDVLLIFMEKTSSKNPSIFWDINTGKRTVVVCCLHSQEEADKIVREIKNCLEQVQNTFDNKMKDFVEMRFKTKKGVLNMVFRNGQTKGDVFDLFFFCLKEDKVSLEKELKDILREFGSSISSKKCKIENTESVIESEATVSGAVKTPGLRNVASWYTPSGNTISVVELASEDCGAELIVSFEESDENFEPTFTTNEINQLCTTILIPKWQGGNKKENHFLDTRTKFVLQEIKKKAFFKIGVNVRPCKTWPKSYKYVKIIIWLIGQFLNDAKNLPFGFTFCVANAEVYRDFKEILKTGLPKHFKPFNETDQGDDSADNRDVKKGDRNIGQAAKSEYPGGARPKMYDYGKEKLFVVPERSRHPGKGGNEEHQRKLKDHKQVIETETEGTQGSDLNRPDEMAGINQNYIRSKPDDALARQKRSLGDGGDGGQASPSYSPGSTGDINDGLTEQEVKAPVSGTDREKEASRLSMPSLLERNKLRVQILKDEITRVKADVIVNSTSVDLNLDRGHVSSQINKRAGTKLQKAVYRNAKKINFWEYIVTSAFDLSNCKHIFHCALEPLNDNDGTKQEKSCLSKMRATVRLLLNEANRMSCNSIALPALGTGYLGYKPRDAATAIFLAVSDFVQFHGDRSHLEDITIVIYQTEENIFQAFKKVEAEMKPELATLTTHF